MIATIGLGANLGDRLITLRSAVAALRAFGDVRASPVYETPAQGGPPQPSYLNAALLLDTTLAEIDLLVALQAIETRFGRVRGERNQARTLDLDLLLVGTRVLQSPELEIPHPRMRERTFVLKPVLDLDPQATHPHHGAVANLYAALLTREAPPRLYCSSLA
jgi:2-amino-4-hydroxy-6-hydroxymethyldihydropteridine diphosphokinase